MSSRCLSPEQIQAYRTSGFAFPIPVLDPTETARFRGEFLRYIDRNRERYEARFWGGRLLFADTHLFLKWVCALVAHDRVLSAVQDLLGPNLVVWSSQWFVKFPGEPTQVDWHQDAIYDAFDPPIAVTAWIALTPSASGNGGMRIIPGAHHRVFQKSDLGSVIFDHDAVEIELQPGEMSVHCAGAVHESRPNLSDIARIGLAVRYISPSVQPRGSKREIAMLVRGNDSFGRFDLVSPPSRDGVPGQSELQTESLERKARNLKPPGTPFANEN
jgi:hypothetical protein